MTEWHHRYGGPGVMIDWHVERQHTCIYGQLKSCSSSEGRGDDRRAATHCTTAEVEVNYVDTHGAFRGGVRLHRMLDFRLLPRLKNIGSEGRHGHGQGRGKLRGGRDCALPRAVPTSPVGLVGLTGECGPEVEQEQAIAETPQGDLVAYPTSG